MTQHVKNFETYTSTNENKFFPNAKIYNVVFNIEKDELINESGIHNISQAFDNEMKYVESSGIGLLSKKMYSGKIDAKIEVDVDTIRNIVDYKGNELIVIVKKELQWLVGSGIFVDSIIEI